MDNQTIKKLLLLPYVTAQFGIITALVLQGRRLRELYDLRDKYNEHSRFVIDLQNRIAITKQIRLLISAKVFASLGQLFAWAGLLYLSPWLLFLSSICDIVLTTFAFSSIGCTQAVHRGHHRSHVHFLAVSVVLLVSSRLVQ